MITWLPFIKKYWKLAAIIALVVYIIVLNQSVRHYRLKAAETARDLKVVTGVVTGENIKTRFYKNKLSEQTAKTLKQDVTISTLQSLMQAHDTEWRKRFDAKAKQIDGATITEALVSLDKLPVTVETVKCPDTLRIYTLKYKDSLNNILIKSIAPIVLRLRVQLYEIDIWERRKLFGFGPRWGKKEWYKEITTPQDSLVKINKQIIYTVRRKG